MDQEKKVVLPRVWIDRAVVEILMRRAGYKNVGQLADAYVAAGLGGRKTVYELVNNETDWRNSTWMGLAGLLGCHPLEIIATEGPLPKVQALSWLGNGRMQTVALVAA